MKMAYRERRYVDAVNAAYKTYVAELRAARKLLKAPIENSAKLYMEAAVAAEKKRDAVEVRAWGEFCRAGMAEAIDSARRKQ